MLQEQAQTVVFPEKSKTYFRLSAGLLYKGGMSMLNIYFGNMPDAVYNTSVYFKNTYKDEWITDELSVKMIKSVDRSEVIDAKTIKSPVFGLISPVKLSGGVKTLILIANDSKYVFNASNCGDNCARWILEIAKHKDITINLRHIMDLYML